MKVILSRKGFDSQYGGQASPILPNGTLLSLPIPLENEKFKYTDLYYEGKSYNDIILELNPNNKQIIKTPTAHLDPDIRFECSKDRNKNWKAIFGQSDASEGHLKKQDVCKDDIFLFFGWFKQTELINNRLRYLKEAPDLHIIYGYLQIDEIFYTLDGYPDYAQNHPHCSVQRRGLKNNTIYVAKESFTLNNSLQGSNTFIFKENLVLTKSGMTRSNWQLPDFFKNLEISYHNRDSFKKDYFKSAGKGQEFVIKSNNQLTDWVKELIESNQS